MVCKIEWYFWLIIVEVNFSSINFLKNEKKFILPALIIAPLLFYLGGLFVFYFVMPNAWQFATLVLAGLLGGVGQILLTSSYRGTDASLIAPFDYASMIFALAIGYFVFAEVPTLTMLGGAGLVIFAGILIIWRERKLGLERARGRKAMTPQG